MKSRARPMGIKNSRVKVLQARLQRPAVGFCSATSRSLSVRERLQNTGFHLIFHLECYQDTKGPQTSILLEQELIRLPTSHKSCIATDPCLTRGGRNQMDYTFLERLKSKVI